jgi:TDG/mug DNA glycosylase family protein
MDEIPVTHATSNSSGLPPVVGERPRVLILGSFPGRQSLLKEEYYANPQNHFWRIMDALFRIDYRLPYCVRILRLIEHRIALWDVISTCFREGSADDRIQNPVCNNLADFLISYPTLRLVALNGSAAGRYYSKITLPDAIPSVILPSTSPANTRFVFSEKVRRWEVVRTHSDGDFFK